MSWASWLDLGTLMNCMKVVNFGWIGHSSSFPICVGCRKADTHWQSGKLWQISISSNLYNCSAPNSGGRWHGGKCGTNLTKAQTGWIFVVQRNFTLLLCLGISPVFPQLIFQNELHLTLLISHSLCPRATGKCSRERELFRREEGSIYPSIRLICHSQSKS